MADLTTKAYWCCQTAKDWSTEYKGYKVTWGHVVRGPYEYDWSCTCQAFKFGGGKPCKHIKKVQDSGMRCAWHQALDGGDLTEDNKCPKCHGPISSEVWGV